MHGLIGKAVVGIAAVALMGSAVSLRAGKIGPDGAKVIRLRGNARYTTDQKTWKELKKGTILKSGALVQTAPTTVLDLCLNEARSKNSPDTMQTADDVIRIFENSALSLDKMAADEVQLDLRAGSIMGTVGKLSATDKYEIKLPRGMVGIRGGTYIADSSGTVNVFQGSALVVIAGADNAMTTKKLSSRQGYDPTSGAVVPLHLETYPPPLTCSDSELPPPPTGTPTSGVPHGPGMGGALRKF